MFREFFKDITRDIRGKRYLLTCLLNWYSVFSITEPLFLVLHWYKNMGDCLPGPIAQTNSRLVFVKAKLKLIIGLYKPQWSSP